MYKFPEETLKALRENRLETLDLGSLGFKGKATLSGHGYVVNSLAVLSDGRLASGSFDKKIRLWNVRSGECEAILSVHENDVSSLAVLSDGRLASGSLDKKIRLWNVRSGVCETTLSGHEYSVYSLALLSDGRLASGSWDKTIRLWNVRSGVCEATLSGHEYGVESLAVLSDGRLASGSADKTIRLWNVRSGECEAILSGHEYPVYSLAVLSDGRLASGSEDKTIRLWNVRSGECEVILSGHKHSVYSLIVLPDGRLASGSNDHTIRLWNVRSGVCEATLSVGNYVKSLAVLPDGRLAAGEILKSDASETCIRLWPIAPDNSLFLNLKSALERNNTLKRIGWTDCESLFNDEEHAWLNALLERNLAVSTLKALRENRLETLDLGALEFKGKATLSGHKDSVYTLALLPDGRLASGSSDNTIRLWNVRSEKCEAILSVHESPVYSLAVLPDGRLASGSKDNTIRLWNVRSGECEATLSGHERAVFLLAMLPDGRLASGSWDKTIRLWNVRSGKCEVILSGHTDAVTSLALLPDGRLASGSHDNTIRLWNVRSGACEAILSEHEDAVCSLAMLPDGRLASGSYDKTIRLWNVRSGECEAILSGHTSYVRSLAMLPDGRLASGSFDHTIRLWNVRSGKCEATLPWCAYAVNSLAVLPDGRLAAGANEPYIRVWPIASDKKLYLDLKSALESNNTLKKIEWSGYKSLFNDEEHAWLNALLERNLASKVAVSLLPPTPKVIAAPEVTKPVAGGAGAIADDAASELAKLKEELAEEKNLRLEAELAAAKLKAEAEKVKEPAAASSFSIISSKDLKLEKELGKGGFGIVYEAKWGEKSVAVKSLLMADLPEKLALEFKSEALLQAALHHENIVELIGVCLEPKKYALVMELLPNGSLFALLHNGKELPWSLRLSIAKDIANGLSYLHQQGIVHRDLKSLNVLLNDRLRAKLSDFGLSDIKAGTVATVGSKSATDGTSTPGTILWMAPELFKRGTKCTEASDIYALGMVFWEIASRALPFKDARDASIAKDWIKDGEREEIPAETPAKIASLIGRCWAQKVEDRPKSTKVVLDELMTETLGGGSSAAAVAGKAAADSGYMMFSR